MVSIDNMTPEEVEEWFNLLFLEGEPTVGSTPVDEEVGVPEEDGEGTVDLLDMFAYVGEASTPEEMQRRFDEVMEFDNSIPFIVSQEAIDELPLDIKKADAWLERSEPAKSLGGSGSGFFDHRGRPGRRGGSSKKGSSISNASRIDTSPSLTGIKGGSRGYINIGGQDVKWKEVPGTKFGKVDRDAFLQSYDEFIHQTNHKETPEWKLSKEMVLAASGNPKYKLMISESGRVEAVYKNTVTSTGAIKSQAIVKMPWNQPSGPSLTERLGVPAAGLLGSALFAMLADYVRPRWSILVEPLYVLKVQDKQPATYIKDAFGDITRKAPEVPRYKGSDFTFWQKFMREDRVYVDPAWFAKYNKNQSLRKLFRSSMEGTVSTGGKAFKWLFKALLRVR